MTFEEFSEFKHLYMTSSDTIKEFIDAHISDQDADGDGIDEQNYFGEICRYARIVMNELHDIGILFIDPSSFLDGYHDLRMIATFNLVFNTDKFLDLMRSCDTKFLENLLGDASAEDAHLKDWFDDLLINIAFKYPTNEDVATMVSHSENIIATDIFRNRIVKLLNHLVNEREGDLI